MLRSETGDDPGRMRAALAGLKAYQQAKRPKRENAAPVVARIGRATLRSYGGAGKKVIFVPSLINGSEVLDLTPENSLIAWLSERGVAAHLLDWGEAQPDESALTIVGHAERYVVPLMDSIGPDVALVGYCLGGLIAIAASTIRPPTALALIATPWDFAGFPSQAREDLQHVWDVAAQPAEALGLFPAEVLQQLFWRLDPTRTIRKFEQFADKDPASPEGVNYIAVEDWANGGGPLTFAAGRDLMDGMLVRNVTGEGRWMMGDRVIDPATLDIPILNIVSTVDRITPAATAWTGGERIALDQGHVGMMVGGRAKSILWTRLSDWLSQLRDS